VSTRAGREGRGDGGGRDAGVPGAPTGACRARLRAGRGVAGVAGAPAWRPGQARRRGGGEGAPTGSEPGGQDPREAGAPSGPCRARLRAGRGVVGVAGASAWRPGPWWRGRHGGGAGTARRGSGVAAGRAQWGAAPRRKWRGDRGVAGSSSGRGGAGGKRGSGVAAGWAGTRAKRGVSERVAKTAKWGVSPFAVCHRSGPPQRVEPLPCAPIRPTAKGRSGPGRDGPLCRVPRSGPRQRLCRVFCPVHTANNFKFLNSILEMFSFQFFPSIALVFYFMFQTLSHFLITLLK